MGVPFAIGNPLARVGSPSGLGLRPRAATARCRCVSIYRAKCAALDNQRQGPGSTALQRGLQSHLTRRERFDAERGGSDSGRGFGLLPRRIDWMIILIIGKET